MYINSLGMRDNAAANVNNTGGAVEASSAAKTASAGNSFGNFSSAIKDAVESQSYGAYGDSDSSLEISEALERLKSDPEWEDVGTALSALYKNQQKMQVQMSLLSSGYSNGLTGVLTNGLTNGLTGSGSSALMSSLLSSGLSSYSQYGSGGSSSYGSSSSLLGSSIFGSFLT